VKIIIAICIILSGCAPTILVHPTKNDAQFQRDLYECQQIATAYVSNMGFAGNPFIINDQTRECMVKKYGWAVE